MIKPTDVIKTNESEIQRIYLCLRLNAWRANFAAAADRHHRPCVVDEACIYVYTYIHVT
jgi:hypothetical protein